GVALWFGNREGRPLVVSGNIKIANTDSVIAKFKTEEVRIPVSSDGEYQVTIQPLEALSVSIEAPGYDPDHVFFRIKPEDVKDSRITLPIKEFRRALGIALTRPGLNNIPTSIIDSASTDH